MSKLKFSGCRFGRLVSFSLLVMSTFNDASEEPDIRQIDNDRSNCRTPFNSLAGGRSKRKHRALSRKT